MRTITIFCDGGLGNRMGVLIGGILLAKKIGYTPIICWPENTWCGCSFEDLFESTDFKIINCDINTLFSSNLDKTFLIHENQTKFELKNVLSHTKEVYDNLKNSDADLIFYHNQISNYFNEYEVVELIKYLKINSYLLDRVKNFCDARGIDKSVYGVHFRKTDHIIVLDDDTIYDNIRKSQDCRYFVCSDDKSTEDRFRQLKNVITYIKTFYVEKIYESSDWKDYIQDNEGRFFYSNINRTKRSVIEAFIDLLILSRTNIIVNTRSTFLNFSKLYSYIDLW